MEGMTMDDLSKKLMRECEGSGLPLHVQAMALGAAYVSYLMAHNISPAALHTFLDKAIGVIEDVKREARRAAMN
jgi:hypothetical protein